MRGRVGMIACAAIAVVGLGLGPAATPARAAEAKTRHCVVSASKGSGAAVCYASFRAAIAAATGGRITDAPNDSRVAMRDRGLQARLNAIDVKKVRTIQADIAPIGIFYESTGFRGSSLIYTGGHPCTQVTTDRDYSVSDVGPLWSDRISSYRAYRNCEVTVYQGV